MNSSSITGIRRIDLGELVDILSGFAFKSAKFNNNGDGLPVVRIRDVVRGFSETYYSGEFDDKYILADGDYLIGMDGEFNLAKWSGGKALLNQRVCKIGEVDQNLDRHYLSRFLPKALKDIEDATPFVTVKHLSAKKIREIQIPLPPLAEQKRIAGILDAADALRAKRRESLAQLDTLLQSTFLDMFGDPVTNPMGWNVSKLEDVVTINPKFRPPETAAQSDLVSFVPMAAVSEVTRSIVEYQDRKLEDVRKGYTAFKRGDVLVAKITPCFENGKMAHATSLPSPFGFGSTEFHVFRASEKFEGEYLFFLLQQEYFRNVGATKMIGAAGQRRVPARFFGEFVAPIPPKQLQHRFAAIVETIMHQMVNQRSHLAELDTLFASLQSRAFREGL